MFLFAFLALALFVVFLIFIGRQSGSIQSGRESQKKFWPDANSNLSSVSADVPPTLLGSVPEAIHQNAPVVNHSTDSLVDSGLGAGFVDYSSTDSTGGALGTALADAIDGGGNSFDAFHSGSDFGGGGTSDGTSS